MSSEKFIKEKELKKLDRELHSIIDRIGLDKKTEDEVFDKFTLLVFDKLISQRIIDTLDFPISTGKEGNVFRATTPDKKFVAVKIYRISTSTFKHISKYIVGDPRFKSLHKSRKDIIFAWTKKEFKNLQRLRKNNVSAPKPIIAIKNVLIMEYIGDKKGSAPLLKDVNVNNPKKVFEKIIQDMEKMYKKANLVHADLSAYNILIHNNRPYFIDIGQSVLIEHPNSKEFLIRDIENISNHFRKYDIKLNKGELFDIITK